MYKLITIFALIFSLCSCAEQSQKTEPNPNVPIEAIQEANQKLDDLVPRIVQVDISSIVEEGKELTGINFLINGIGYPTKLNADGTVLLNIAGLDSGIFQFKARMRFKDKTETQREFVVKVDDTMELIAPMQ